MTSSPNAANPAHTALLAGLVCYLTWGLAPLVYQPMGRAGAGALEIMGHRAIWSVLLCGLIVMASRQIPELMRVLRNPRLMGLLFISTLLIAFNWAVFVWAVNNKHTLETSLGYYLNPLLNMAAGAILFQERLDRFGKAAIALALVGVGFQALALGQIPIISLALALSFGAYGVMRKRMDVTAQTGLLIECLYMTLPGLGLVWWLESQGQGHFFDSPQTAFWLLMAGPMTVVPLVLFSWAARRMPLSTMGFLQFLAPTISFMIGVAQGEDFTLLRGVSFAFIWGGAAVFAAGAFIRVRRLQRDQSAL